MGGVLWRIGGGGWGGGGLWGGRRVLMVSENVDGGREARIGL